MTLNFFTFEYDYEEEHWNLPRGTVPPELKAQGVPHALWMHFWDYSQSVVERASVRSIMKKKLRMECDKGNLSERRKQEREAEITKLDDQTKRDFDCLQTQAERLFPNTIARVNDSKLGKRFGLEIQLLQSAAGVEKTISLQYDATRSTWNLPRDAVPSMLAERGVSLEDWMSVWDHGFGVNQRAKEREHLNQLHDRELRLCKKSLSYMTSTGIASVDADSMHNSSASHIRTKMEKLRRAMEANSNNTKKGWQELQRKAAQKFEPCGVKVYLSTQDEQVYCGLKFQCTKQQSREPSNTVGSKRTSSFNHTAPSSIWLPTSSPIPSSPPRERTSPIPAIWMTLPKHLSSPKPQTSEEPDNDENSSARPKTPEKENAPPKPEAARKHRKRETTYRSWGQPIVLTYVHEDLPSQIDIEVSAPFTPISSFDDEDSHGYVVPPAPSKLPSIGSSSSSSSMKPPKVPKRVRFSESTVFTYEHPGYTKADRKRLWFTHEEREASRSKTKVLAQRVIDNRNSGGANNVVFMDMETEEEVCWRGLEHAKKGNLSSRQETRRAFLLKVLEKQRTLTLNSWTKRPGTTEDPAKELQEFASRHSRECRERAHKLAAQDAKEARAVYKESLRKPNLQQNLSSCGSQSTNGRSQPSYHQNDIFQDYCRQVHLATKSRMQPSAAA